MSQAPFKWKSLRTSLTIASTLQFVAYKFHLSEDEIKSKTRRHEVILPRSIAIWIASKNNPCSKIGRYIGKDPTTIIYARDKIERMMQENESFKASVLSIEAELLENLPKPAIPAISKPHLGAKESEGNEEIGPVPTVDSGG